jgi:hypothetical protein
VKPCFYIWLERSSVAFASTKLMQSLNSVQAFTEGVPDIKATKARQVKKERSNCSKSFFLYNNGIYFYVVKVKQ